MNILERLYFEQPGGMFREFEGLTTHFEPKDPSLNRKLLPEQFDTPRQPVVTIFVANYLTEQQNRDLFSHICQALVPDGRLVLDVPMGTEQPDENSSFLSLVLWANSGGRAYLIEEYRAWLLDTGFAEVSQLSPRLLMATS